jgi:hypothetical protein
MPSRVIEDDWEVEAAVIEPVAFGGAPWTMSAYPLTQLRLLGRSEVRSFPVVVLSNPFLRAVVCPALGGRVVGIGEDPPARLSIVESGPRSLSLTDGVQLTLAPGTDGFAPFDHLVHEPKDGSSPAAVMVFGSVQGTGLSLQVVYSLPPDSPELLVEARVFNRTLEWVRFGIAVLVDGRAEDAVSETVLAPRDTRAIELRLGVGPTISGIEQNDMARADLPSGRAGDPPGSLPIQLRGAAYLRSAHRETLLGDLGRSLAHVDSALATLGDDPLCWWHRAVLARLLGERDDESVELSTAHALSPMEPLLKAEAFLSMPQTHGREPSPLMRSLAMDGDALHECVHLYAEAGFLQEASRLIDEAQRHREFPLLRYMNAWMLMAHTRMEAEAASEVARASKHALEPPFPWRPLEVEAVTLLAARFPSDPRLESLKALLDKRSSPAT